MCQDETMRQTMDGAAGVDPARRQLLYRVAALAVALAPFAAVRAADSATAGARALRFVHTHTGERLDCEYFHDGRYDAAALERVNHFLRDFRSDEVHPIDPGVLDILNAVQRQSGCDGTYEVISGYRSPRTNAALRSRSTGVAEHSLHMQGRAIDVRLSGLPTMQLHEIALGLKRGGVGFYPRSDFVHLDTGRVRYW
jgi:uncharacterized protein YcbK (DUF882 family)